MGQKNVSEFFFQFTDLLSDIFDNSEIVPHERYFLLSAYQRLLGGLLNKCETELTQEQKEYNKLQLDRFLKRIAELVDETMDKLPKMATIGTPLYIPAELIEKWDPERMEGELRIEAIKWLNSGGKKVIGRPSEMSTITMNDQERSIKMVRDLCDKGAEHIEVIDPPVGGNEGVASIIRVTLPWDPTENTSSGNAPTADKALAVLSYISELDACSIKQDPDMENTFYVSWIEE